MFVGDHAEDEDFFYLGCSCLREGIACMCIMCMSCVVQTVLDRGFAAGVQSSTKTKSRDFRETWSTNLNAAYTYRFNKESVTRVRKSIQQSRDKQ